MRKTKKLSLSRETLLSLDPGGLREAAGGVTTPYTHCLTCITNCNQSVCIDTCKFCTRVPCTQ